MRKKKRIQAGILTGLVVMIFIFLLQIDGWIFRKLQQESMFDFLCPAFSYASPELVSEEDIFEQYAQKFLLGIWDYMEEYPVYEIQCEDPATVEWILIQEARDEENHEREEETGNKTLGELLIEENADSKADSLSEDTHLKKQSSNLTSEAVWTSDEERVAYYESLKDFDTLLKEFYLVDEHTSITAKQLDAKEMLSRDMTITKESTEPQILIYHTHSQEGFVDSVPGDASTTVVGAGEKLAKILEEEYGFHVLHHTGEYDVESRDYAYANAEPALETILKENPSIEVVIDLHRDGVSSATHLLTEQNGVEMAQFMFFNGLSRTNATGDISYLENPYIQENLAFSFQLQLKCREYYPGLARKIYLKGYRYNMHFRAKSLLIELGAQTNTVEEVMNAVPLIARMLAMVLAE